MNIVHTVVFFSSEEVIEGKPFSEMQLCVVVPSNIRYKAVLYSALALLLLSSN